ncbi:hypothetical protein FO440_11100 [Mucilaginibacter corticis]|uniref:Fucosyltransferase C-terminal domain-containing protein n=1 Tax=Mucilaginibacter corticis TaxID=2597670 RepID=A0A556MKA3_9SPHI|nr:glycosyltransferase family 10 [Mucilaginibacter corticis]TSJ40299.1 hypothetical protein FO440_11100 [Mucilaginibacter corticis]
MNNRKKYRVKFTFPHDWPIMRQTPKFSGTWGDYEFFLNNAVTECDFWVLFSKYDLKKEACYCPPENIIFMPSEAYSIEQFSKQFLKQFALIITCQKEIVHPNVSYNLGGHPWFVGKNYDELLEMAPINKTKKISLITSNKVITDGHKKRLDFAYKLKEYFKDDIDLFGRGIKDFDDKWDVLAPYQYSIAIENDFCDDWLTEKFFDCHLSFTYPFYYGCPNAEKYFSPKSFSRINIDDFNHSVKVIESILLNENYYTEHLQFLEEERIKVLNNYNIFPLLTSYMDNMNPFAEKKEVVISPEFSMRRYIKKIFQTNGIR